ncbi:hypothetical protein AB3N60_18580 [Leptospira sp. WS39.C2]
MINYEFDFINILFHSAGSILTILLIINLDIIGNWNKIKEFFFFIIFLRIAEQIVHILLNIFFCWPYSWYFENDFVHSISTILFTWDGFYTHGKIGLWSLIFKTNYDVFFKSFIAFLILIKIYPLKYTKINQETLDRFTIPFVIYLLIIYFCILLSDTFQNGYTTNFNLYPFTKTIELDQDIVQIWNLPFIKMVSILTFLGFVSVPKIKEQIKNNLFYLFIAYYALLEFGCEFLTISSSYVSIFSMEFVSGRDFESQTEWSGMTGIQIVSIFILFAITVRMIMKRNDPIN